MCWKRRQFCCYICTCKKIIKKRVSLFPRILYILVIRSACQTLGTSFKQRIYNNKSISYASSQKSPKTKFGENVRIHFCLWWEVRWKVRDLIWIYDECDRLIVTIVTGCTTQTYCLIAVPDSPRNPHPCSIFGLFLSFWNVYFSEIWRLCFRIFSLGSLQITVIFIRMR